MPRALVLVAALLLGAPAAPAQDRPNIVLVLADDLGIGDPGCFNPDSKIPTPNIDRLAGEGLRFTDAHSPSAVCTPTRYGILTGRYAWRTRLHNWVLDGDSRLLIEPGRATIASMLDGLGYRTAAVGKWHLGLGAFDPAHAGSKADYSRPFDAGPRTVGFDRAFLVPASLDMPPYVFIRDDRPIEPLSRETPGSKRRWDGGGGFWRAGPVGETFDFDQCLPRLTDEALAFIAEAPRDAEPFFLYFPMTAPHTPWMPIEPFRRQSGAGWYGDFVVEVDAMLGRVLDALDAAGMRDNTIVIFASDNGAHWRERDEQEFGHLANLDYRGMKADIHEAGHRVPCIARWPGVTPAGSRCDALVGLLDLYATVAEVVGVEPGRDEGPDSVSFASLLHAPAARGPRDSLVLHSGDGMFAIRRGDWKLVEGLGSGGFTTPARAKPEEGGPTGQLYNLADDPGETRNLFLEQTEIVADLTRELERIRSGG